MLIELTVEGVTPLICNRFTDAAQLQATNQTRISTVGDRGTPTEIADKKLYRRNGDDDLCVIPSPNVLRCFIDAGTFFKAGKSKVTTLKSSIIPFCVSILEADIPIVTTNGWNVDTRAVCIPSTGGRILCHRPKFEDWRLAFTVELDTDVMHARFFREIVDAAGKKIGLGDFRPARKGPFGRFSVIRWEES